jgi:hypothetical protein
LNNKDEDSIERFGNLTNKIVGDGNSFKNGVNLIAFKYSRRHFVTKNIMTHYENIAYSIYVLEIM